MQVSVDTLTSKTLTSLVLAYSKFNNVGGQLGKLNVPVLPEISGNDFVS